MPNETVENLFFRKPIDQRSYSPDPFLALNAIFSDLSIKWGLLDRPKSVDFPDIVDQYEQPQRLAVPALERAWTRLVNRKSPKLAQNPAS